MTAVQKVQGGKVGHGGKALELAADLAMKDIKKVQQRMTEQLASEDAVVSLKVVGGRVKAEIDNPWDFKEAGLKQMIGNYLKKHGAPASTPIDLVKVTRPERAVAGAWADIQRIQQRLTRELRAEDGIAGLSLKGEKTVVVALKANQPYAEDEIKRLVKEHLKANGLTGARIEFVRPAIEPIPPHVVVSRAWEAIQQVQGRMTTDMRAEDDIRGMHLDSGNTVKVVLGPRPYFPTAEIEATAKRHLEAAGFRNANIEFIRPAVDPIRPPVVRPPSQNTMKAKVDAFNDHLKTVHSRMTEEIRVEDSVSHAKLSGAKVIVTLQRGAVSGDGVKEWVKQELKDRGITLPVKFVEE